jgi:hypothetical protein
VIVQVALQGPTGSIHPTWTLSTAEIEELSHRLLGILPAPPPVDSTAPARGGFVLKNPRRIADIPELLLVWHGLLTLTDQGYTAYYLDSNGIESWLGEQLQRYGYNAAGTN